MKAWIRTGLVAAVTVCGTFAYTAQDVRAAWAQPTSAAAADDNMTPYRTMAADALKAFQSKDMNTAKKKAKELESAWDGREKALKKSSPKVWDKIDKAMDDFIKPVQDKKADPAKVQKAYDAFVADLQEAVK